MRFFAIIFSGIFIVNNMSSSQEAFNMFDYLPLETIVHILHHTVKHLGYPFIYNEHYKKDLYLCAVSRCFYYALVELIKERHDFDKEKMGYSLVRYLYCQQYMPSAYRIHENQIKRRSGAIALTLLSIEAGADVNVKDFYGRVALQFACQHSPEIVLDLINVGADVGANSNAALMIASRYQCELISLLLEAGADVNQANSSGWTPLMVACRYQQRVVLDLIDAGANLNKVTIMGYTALMFACKFQSSAVCKLIKAGADVNAVNNKNESALLLACEYNRLVVPTLIGAGADVNQQSSKERRTPLMVACQYHPELVKLLLKSGADVNKINNDKETALFIACRYSQQVISLLLESGIDVNIKNSFGHTALFYAVRRPNIIPLLAKNIDLSKLLNYDLGCLLRWYESHIDQNDSNGLTEWERIQNLKEYCSSL